MINFINNTKIFVSKTKAESVSVGGTSTFVSGFINYLLSDGKPFCLVGCFVLKDPFCGCYKYIKKSSNSFFLLRLFYIFLFHRRLRQDIFYSHRPDHLAISLLAHGKHVVHLHGQPHTTINKGRGIIKKKIYNTLEKFSLHRADLIIATDQLTANLYSSLYPRVGSRLTIIPTGINLQEFHPQKVPQTFPGIVPLTKNIAFVGRLAYPKQVSEILTAFDIAFQNNPSVHLWIVGTGKDESDLKVQASKLESSKNIHFVGRLSRENVKLLMHSVDAGILISQNEGSPISIKEFLACGKPVIVNNVGDLAEYVTDGINGFIVDPRQPLSIEHAMLKVLEESKEMAAACRESILRFDDQKIYEKVLQSLLKLETTNEITN